MVDLENQNQAPPPLTVAESQSQPQPQEGDREEEDASKKEDDELISKALSLMEKITSAPDNPKATVLHALASILETQEFRYFLCVHFHILFLLFLRYFRPITYNYHLQL